MIFPDCEVDKNIVLVVCREIYSVCTADLSFKPDRPSAGSCITLCILITFDSLVIKFAVMLC